MMRSSKQILAEKMRLESYWNISYLENGYVTPEMNNISYEIKKCRRELVQRDELDAKFENLILIWGSLRGINMQIPDVL